MKEQIKSDETRLSQYINFFERYKTQDYFVNEKGGTDYVSFFKQVNYRSECDLFIRWVYETNLIKSDYLDYLNQHSVILRRSKEVKEKIEVADFILLRSILTYYIRGERICSGLFECATRDGIFLAILKRIKYLQDKN